MSPFHHINRRQKVVSVNSDGRLEFSDEPYTEGGNNGDGSNANANSNGSGGSAGSGVSGSGGSSAGTGGSGSGGSSAGGGGSARTGGGSSNTTAVTFIDRTRLERAPPGESAYDDNWD